MKTYSLPRFIVVMAILIALVILVVSNAGAQTPGLFIPDVSTSVFNASLQHSLLDDKTPKGAVGNDGTGGIEVGVKFKPSIDGFVTGVKFYKVAQITGTKTGELYSSSGSRLGQITFTNETDTGWQWAFFSQPIPITANTVYVAALFSPSGSYIADDGYFSKPTVDSPLYADNGYYSYSKTPTLPKSNYLSSNYWVDVVFQQDTASTKAYRIVYDADLKSDTIRIRDTLQVPVHDTLQLPAVHDTIRVAPDAVAIDTIYIPAGEQPGFQTRSNTVYINQGGQVVFTGQIKLGRVKNVSFISQGGGYGFKSIYAGHSVFGTGTGGNQNISIDGGFDFGNSADVVFDASTKIWIKAGYMMTYDGSPDSTVFWNLKVNNFKVSGKTKLYEGTFESPRTMHMYSVGLNFTNGLFVNDGTGENIKISGNSIFGLNCDHWTITGPTINLHDCGIVFISGSGKLSNFYRHGGWGYDMRISIVKLAGIPFNQDCGIYNCISVNTTHYGSLDVRVDTSLLIPGLLTGGSFDYQNNTIGDRVDGADDSGAGAGTYVTDAVVAGDMAGYTLNIKNNIAWNADNRSGMANGSSLLKNNAPAKSVNLVTGNNIDLPPGQPLPAGYFIDKTSFVPITAGPLDGKGIGAVTISGPASIAIHDTITLHDIVIKPVHDTTVIRDTIPRVCPPPVVCPICPPQRTVDKIIFDGKTWMLKYDDGSETEL